MDFQDKAKAIWAALDNMAESNPESYRQFIHDQLHGDGAAEMWKQLGLNNPLNNARPGSTASSAAEKGANTNTESEGNEGQASGILSSRRRSFLTTSNTSRLSADSGHFGPPVDSQEPSSSQQDLTTSLLDDSFSHSSLLINPLLARIVDEEEDQEPLFDLSLPSAPNHNGDGECPKGGKGNSKPLIEEI